MKCKKIIIVEDDKMLLTVFSLFVKELGHEVIGAYTNAEKAIEQCNINRPDVVLMDINLPGSIDGITAADKIYYEFDVPIIYISSYTDETTVTRAIKSSTYGYLVKPIDKISLGITIDLVYSKHKNDHQSRIGEIIIDHINDAILTVSLNGKITFCNKGSEKVFGIDKSQITGNLFASLFTPNSIDYIQENVIEKTLSDGEFETELIIKSHSNVNKYVYISLSVLNDEIDEVFGLICYCKDITNKREIEEYSKINFANLKAIFNGATEAIYIVNRDFILLNQNKLAFQYQQKLFKTNYKTGDSIYSVLNFLSHDDLKSLINTTLEGVSHVLERVIILNNAERYFKITIYPIIYDENCKIERFCISLLDITENKRIEKDLDETKNELKPLFDSSIQRFYLSDLNLKMVAFNKAARDVIMREFNRQIKRGDNVLDFVPTDERQKHFIEMFAEAKKGHSIVYKEKISIRETDVWNETHLDPVMNERGEIYRILIWTLDVTERERNLNDLRETQERYALVAKGGNDGIWDWNMLTETVYLSPRWKALLGYEDYELKNEFGVRDGFIHPDDLEKSKKNLEDFITGKIPAYENEIRLKHKNGTYVWVLERGVLLNDAHEKPIRLAGSITDISRQKNIENEIRETNKMLLEEREMFIRGSVVIARIKATDSKNIVYISENVKEVLGYDVKEFYSGNITYDAIIHSEDKIYHVAERNEALNRNASHIEFSPYRMIRKDGTFLWVKDFATIIRDVQNNITEILGYFIDITGQKKSEEILLESQKKYFSMFKDASDAMVIVDNNDVIYDCNEKLESLFGYNRNELVNNNVLKLMPEIQPSGQLSIEKRKSKIEEAYKGKVSTYYWKYKRKDETLFDAEVSLTTVTLQNKKYLHASIRDITERKTIERNLSITEQKNKALLEAIPDLLFIIDKNGVYKYFKPDIYHELEVPAEFVVGKTLDFFFKNEMLEKVRNCINIALSKGEVQMVEYELDSPKGMRLFEARISKIDDENILMLVRDKIQSNHHK